MSYTLSSLFFSLVLFGTNGASFKIEDFGPSEMVAETERREICMGELGCFRNTQPFDLPASERIISLLPDEYSEIGTEFRFFSPKNSETAQYVTNWNFTSWNIGESGFDPAAKTKFVTHGYMGGNAEWAVRLKNAMIRKDKCNVFIVDWTNGHGPLYEQAVANIRVVGAEIGFFIQKLMSNTKLDLQKVHLIGHSLGSHASGYAGKWVQNKEKGKKVGRISGLDPAGPYFNEVYQAVRLDALDAMFVDVIHTNWAEHRLSGFGLIEAIGHFDFYPNGGEDMPGCPSAGDAAVDILKAIAAYPATSLYDLATGEHSTTPVGDKLNAVSCSHGRAYEYFIASVEDDDCEFRSLQCFSWQRYLNGECGTCSDHFCIVMGYYADRYKRFAAKMPIQGHIIPKKFFLRTTANAPYCLEKLEPKFDMI